MFIGKLLFKPSGSDKWVDLGEVQVMKVQFDHGLLAFQSRITKHDRKFLEELKIIAKG